MFGCSFIFWAFIWKLGPIPSSAYPYVQKFWPFHATMQAFWAKSTLPGAGSRLVTQIIRWDYIGIGLAFSGALYAVLIALVTTVTQRRPNTAARMVRISAWR